MLFSHDTKEVISESRNIAIDLGYDYISTIHIFLADCKRHSNYTIKNFAFRTDEELQQFYDGQIKGLPDHSLDSLPLTKEAEDMLRRSVVLVKSTYNARAVQPWHLFLAGSQLQQTQFYSILTPKEGLYERLDKYYTDLGVINRTPPPPPSRKSFWSRLFK
jgi:ATP-dependent Clp protease ATP-binding subunit ClpA